MAKAKGKSKKKRTLTEMQKKFIDYYIETANATQAAIKAGYSKNSADRRGHINLQLLEPYIRAKMEAKDKERIASQDEVLQYLTAVLRGDVQEEQIVTEGQGEGFSTAILVKKQVAPRDRNKAAEMLAKRYGLLTDNININGNTQVVIVDDIGDTDDG